MLRFFSFSLSSNRCTSGKSAVLLVLAVIASLALVPAYSAKVPNPMTPEELATLKFRVSVEGIAFDVPANYHYSEFEMYREWPRPPKAQVEGKERTKVDVIKITALLPDLSPYTEENAAEFRAPGLGKEVIGYMARRRINWEYWFSNAFKRMKRMPGLPEMPGMLRYRDPLARYDVYLSHDKPQLDSNLKRIICPDFKPKQLPSCELQTPYLDRFDLEIRFSRSYLHQWREIEQKMKALLDSFRESAQP